MWHFLLNFYYLEESLQFKKLFMHIPDESHHIVFRISAFLGFCGVALGAFGAHGLRDHFIQFPQHADYWNKAVFYQLIHVAVLLVLTRMDSSHLRSVASPLSVCILFILGIVFFSGSLYTLVLTNTRWLGMITPIGGLCFLLGWIWMVVRPPASLLP